MNIQIPKREYEYVDKELEKTKRHERRNFLTPLSGFSVLLNIILPTAPFILPRPFYACGILLGSFFLVIVMFFAYVTIEFLIECFSIANAIEIRTKNPLMIEEGEVVASPEETEEEDGTPNNIYSLRKTIEYSTLGEILMGRCGKIITNFIMIVYLYGSLCIKLVVSSHSLATGLSFIFTGSIDGITKNYFDLYYLTCAFWFVFGAITSIKNIQNTKKIQICIIIIRIIVIVLMIAGALSYITVRQDPFPDLNIRENLYNISNFSELYGSVIFSFFTHHCISGIISPMRPEKKIKKVVFLSYICGTTVLFFLLYTSYFAFGGLERDCNDGFPCKLQLLYNTNFLGIPVIGHIINFYLCLNIAPFPVVAITLKNSLFKLFYPNLEPVNDFNLKNFFFLTIVMIPVGLISLILRNNLDKLLAFTGGVTGAIIMLVLPCIFIFRARSLNKGLFKAENRFHGSNFRSWVFPVFICICGLLSTFYSGYLRFTS